MTKSILSFLIIIPFFISCYHENNDDIKKPETFISFDKMTEMLTDIQIAEGIIVNNRAIRENNDSEFKDSMYAKIFQHYGVSPTVFKENINYYNNDPAVMEDIFDIVLANLSKEQSQIQMEAAEEDESEAELIKTDSTLVKNDSIKD